MKFFRPFRPLLEGWLLSFAGWGLIGLTMTVHSMGRGSWEGNLHASVRDWLPWAILTPILFRLVSRAPIERGKWHWTVPLHIGCAALIVAAVHYWKGLTDSSPGMIHHGPEMAVGPPDLPPPPDAEPFIPQKTRLGPPFPPPRRFDLLYALSFELPIYLMIVSAAHTMHFYRRAEVRAGQLAAARLQALQAQLQPHFLFNTLNAIAGLVHKSPDKADSALTMLSDLLRFSLETTTEAQIPLEREIQFIEKYLAIMRMRYDDRVRYDVQIEPGARGAQVPTLLLQPLVENAIKYGIEPNPSGGKVEIRAWRAADLLHLSVLNTGAPMPSSSLPEGVGLSSTRARLREFFGNQSSMEIRNDGAVTIEITFPYRSAVR